MSRLIDADVLKAIYDPSSYEGHGPNENWDNVVSTFEEIRTDIDDQPTVDVAPVVHGHWITDEDLDAYCSVCGDRWGGNIDTDLFKYCPHCGAKMDEVTK